MQDTVSVVLSFLFLGLSAAFLEVCRRLNFEDKK